jgi:hypothetical protein
MASSAHVAAAKAREKTKRKDNADKEPSSVERLVERRGGRKPPFRSMTFVYDSQSRPCETTITKPTGSSGVGQRPELCFRGIRCPSRHKRMLSRKLGTKPEDAESSESHGEQ